MPVAHAERVVHSPDGTTIGYRTIGTGPDVLLVPGALSDASDFTTLAELLAADFTVHTIQRRGRRGSGPLGPGYSIEAEVADLAAVRAATGAAFVFGHSYGGLVALEAARRDPTITKLAVYEPGVSVEGSIPTAWMVLLMSGGKTGLPYLAASVARLAEVLPRARALSFSALDHFGPHHKGEAEVAAALREFFVTAA